MLEPHHSGAGADVGDVAGSLFAHDRQRGSHDIYHAIELLWGLVVEYRKAMWKVKKMPHLLFMTGLKRSEIWVNLGQSCLEGRRNMNPINAIVWICIFAFGVTSILTLVHASDKFPINPGIGKHLLKILLEWHHRSNIQNGGKK